MKKLNVFYSMSGVTINHEDITPNNIDSFGLNKVFESEIADIYATHKNKKYGQFILHIKCPSLYAKDNRYLLDKNFHLKPYVIDWFEHNKKAGETLQEDIEYIKERL